LSDSHEHTAAGIAPINQTFSDPGTPSRRAVNSVRMVANITVTAILNLNTSCPLREHAYGADQTIEHPRGFIVSDFAAHRSDFLRDMSAWVGAGKVKYKEYITEGLDNAPGAFMGLLKGANFGKQLVRVGPDKA
jgi:NADPH-dependent curcumin reductase CurA